MTVTKNIHNAVSSTEIRLNKAIAAAGLCSRRKADDLILQGMVQVDGMVETNPGRRITSETITVLGKHLQKPQDFYYYLLHKPVHTVCTVYDPQGRPTVLDCLPETVRKIRLYPVGRLDYFSEGLLLLTNDGELAQRLTHPRYHLPKTYEVLLRESPSPTDLATMRQGMTLTEGEKLLPVTVDVIRALPQGRCLLRMILRQGVNRQIRRMCRDLELTVLRLRRVAQGPLQLGSLAYGQTRVLSSQELSALKEEVGLLSCRNDKNVHACHAVKGDKTEAGPSPVMKKARLDYSKQKCRKPLKNAGKEKEPRVQK